MNSVNTDDYMMDAQGRLVPKEMVKELDRTRDELVQKLIADAKAVQLEMADFKRFAMEEIKAFISLAAMEWDTKYGGDKGNVTLHSYDGKLRIQIQVSDSLVFDEQLQIAKKMIDQCLIKWTEGGQARPEIKAIINDAFQVDKEGQINTKRILSLRGLNITDKLWLKAMEAITASLKVIGSKEYIRLYERGSGKDQWRPITLDLAAL